MIKKYYKYEFQLTEPLSLGSGDNKYSDRDILRNGEGEPFVPGSSLAGVYRACFEVDTVKKYFGDLENDEQESLVLIYDAVLKNKDYTISVRDSVGLDEYKNSKEGAKFDFEIIEPGAVFVTYLEQNMENGNDIDIGSKIAEKYLAGEICLGHKTMRGYGKVKVLEANIWQKSFEIPKELTNWLDFDMYTPNAFGKRDIYQKKVCCEQDCVKIKLDLKQKSGISIRKYTSDVKPEGELQPGYTQMFYLTQNNKECPVIPGTSWAGAFRHHMKNLLQGESSVITDYFGTIDGAEAHKSRVRFSESYIEGDVISKNIMRTAIDRFTGGTVDGALYTEKTYFGGTTTLEISFPRKVSENDIQWRQLLAVAITDLDMGFLCVGGLTAVGRGLFEVESCVYDEKEIYTAKNKQEMGASPVLYDALINAMNGTEKGENLI